MSNFYWFYLNSKLIINITFLPIINNLPHQATVKFSVNLFIYFVSILYRLFQQDMPLISRLILYHIQGYYFLFCWINQCYYWFCHEIVFYDMIFVRTRLEEAIKYGFKGGLDDLFHITLSKLFPNVLSQILGVSWSKTLE